MLGAVELADAGDVHGAGADALDPRPHFGQQGGEVRDVGIGRGVDDDRVSLRETGGHDKVLDPGVARQVEVHLRAAKVVRPDVVAVRAGARNRSPHAGEPAVVVVGRPGADRAAPHLFDRHLPEAAEKGPYEQQRGAQPVRQLAGKLGGGEGGRVYHGDPFAGIVVDPRPQAAQDLHCQKHVLHGRDAVQDGLSAFGENRRGDHRQSGVLGTLNHGLPGQGGSTFDVQGFGSHQPSDSGRDGGRGEAILPVAGRDGGVSISQDTTNETLESTGKIRRNILG